MAWTRSTQSYASWERSEGRATERLYRIKFLCVTDCPSVAIWISCIVHYIHDLKITPPTNEPTHRHLMLPLDVLGPGATVFAALFGGTVGAWFGARLALNRFKQERAFDRRVEWYERIARAIQQLRSITWEMMTTVSQMPSQRYTELSKRASTIAREFDDLAAERYIYAKKPAADAVGGQTLASFRLQHDIPAQQPDKKVNGFWERQHRDWSRVHQLVSAELQHELFPNRSKFIRRLRLWPKRGSAIQSKAQNSSSIIHRLRSLFSSDASVNKSDRGNTDRQASPKTLSSQADTSPIEQVDREMIKTTVDLLFHTDQARAQLGEEGDPNRLAAMSAIQVALLRNADLRSLLVMLRKIRNSNDEIDGWHRKHIARILALTLSENAEQFENLLNVTLREPIQALGSSDTCQKFERLLTEVREFRSTYTLRLQGARNTIIAQHFPTPKLDLHALRRISVDEMESLAAIQVGWNTRLFEMLASLTSSQ